MPARLPTILYCSLSTPSRRLLSVRRHVAFYSTPTTPPIKVTSIPAPHSGSIKILSLNRPSARNAISRALLTSLSHEITTISSEPPTSSSTRAVILASELDSCFCAGADLKERLSYTQRETETFLTDLRSTFSALAALPVPTIAAVSSTAFGGGLELALCAHLRVFASTAVVGLPETRLGIIPGAGGTYRLPSIIGMARARDLILTGRRVGGPEAYFLGLCDRLVEMQEEDLGAEGVVRGKVLQMAVQLAREICEGAPIAIRAALEAVEGCAMGQKAENAAYDKVLHTEDRTEALKAFAAKRPPVFKGR